MNDDGHMASIVRGELSKSMNQRVLFEETISIGIVHSHHELKIIDDHMTDIVDRHGIAHRLQRASRSVNSLHSIYLR
jgi:hypothetical protein